MGTVTLIHRIWLPTTPLVTCLSGALDGTSLPNRSPSGGSMIIWILGFDT